MRTIRCLNNKESFDKIWGSAGLAETKKEKPGKVKTGKKPGSRNLGA